MYRQLPPNVQKPLAWFTSRMTTIFTEGKHCLRPLRYTSIVIVLLLLVACNSTPQEATLFEGTPSALGVALHDEGSTHIALVMKTLTNPFFIEMEQGARRAEQEFDIELTVRTGAQETSIDQQIAIVEELIADGVNAIVIAPGSSTELIPVLKRAQDAGIAIVNIDNRLDAALSSEFGLVDVPFISVDNEAGAYLSAQCITEALTEPTEVIVLTGIMEAQNAKDRLAGATRALNESPHVNIVAVETAHWKIDEAYTVTEQLVEAHPEVKGIFASNDMMALGAAKYLEDVQRTDVLVAGYDALTEAVTAVEEGRIICTINQRADEQGYLGVKYALDLLNGETVPPLTLVDVELVGKDR